MGLHERIDPALRAQILQLVTPLLKRAPGVRREKLAALGFALEERRGQRTLVTLPHRVPVMQL